MLRAAAPFVLLLTLAAPPAAGQDARVRAHADLRSDDPARVRGGVLAFGRHARALRGVDLEALSRAAALEPVRIAAAPELRVAFARVAAGHPDPVLRRRAAREVAGLEHDARTTELRRLAHDLQAAGAGGVALWTAVARRAVELHERRPDLTAADRWDEVLADLGRVFNGRRSLELLAQYDRVLGKLPGSDPLVPRMVERLAARTAEVAWAGYDLDATASDFRPELQDGSRGQVYHSNFFFLLGYTAGREDPRLPHLINLRHETIDDSQGHCVADWLASAVAIEAGRRARRLRDEGGDLRQLPTILGAAFARDPAAHARPWGDAGPDLSSLVADVDAEARARIASPRGQGRVGRLASRAQRGLVEAFERLRGEDDGAR